eukprot:1363418-Rhodomonas_salina.3
MSGTAARMLLPVLRRVCCYQERERVDLCKQLGAREEEVGLRYLPTRFYKMSGTDIVYGAALVSGVRY